MIRIKKIEINRYRSISKLKLDINEKNGLTSLCGKNNVGKTNTLRAINLFFNPNDYDVETDIPARKKATGGNSIHPKIEITFLDSESNDLVAITRDFKNIAKGEIILYGYKKINSKGSKITLSNDETEKFR